MVKYILSHFNFLLSDSFTLLKSFVRTFCLFRILHGRYYLDGLSPAAPAAWAAASGPAPVSAPGRGRLHRSRLASSRALAAPAPPLLASRVQVAALVCRQLAVQITERGRHRPGRRRRRRLSGLSRREGGGLHWNHGFQPRPLPHIFQNILRIFPHAMLSVFSQLLLNLALCAVNVRGECAQFSFNKCPIYVVQLPNIALTHTKRITV